MSDKLTAAAAGSIPVPAGARHAPRQRVPLVDLRAQYGSLREEALEAIRRVCDSQQFVLGDEVAALERELSAKLGVRHAVGTSSGTDALLVALIAAGVGAGDEVITSAFSFFATAGSIARLGARPVLVDIDSESFNLDPRAVAEAVGPRTRAILPVHLYGLAADMEAIGAIAREHSVVVIEDACQAIGSRVCGRAAGTLGTFGCFSFYPTKTLGGFGDGGLVVTDDEEMARTVRLLREHGADAKYHHILIGGNFRLDALQAAVLRVKMPFLDGWVEARRQTARRYADLFELAGLAGRVGLPPEPPGSTHAYHQFVVRVARRDELVEHLAACGVGSGMYYPVPLHLQPCFASLGYVEGDLPRAEQAARETLALPIYPELTHDQQSYVVDCIADFVRQH